MPQTKTIPDKNKNPHFVYIVTGLVMAYLIFSILNSMNIISQSQIQSFNTIFISILIQAFPFMLIGVLVSSFMHVFIPDEFVVKIFPKKHGLGFITAMFAGIFFPVCECAIVPVMKRLVKKGVPMPIALTFMFSAPIINPIVIVSTLYAFPGQPEIALYRVLFGLFIALCIGLFFLLPFNNKEDFFLDLDSTEHSCSCGCCHDSHEHTHSHDDTHKHSHDDTHKHDGTHKHEKIPIGIKLKEMLLHSGEEFFDVGKYLIIGAFFTSLAQMIIPSTAFDALNAQNILALLIMMLTAFIFSACSTSDAFIARSFVNKFSMSSIMGFLVYGPMMDVKNILMLNGSFKKKFILKLCVTVTVMNFVVLLILTKIFL